MTDDAHSKETEKGLFRHENGRTYYSRDTERRFFFVLTIIMLVLGLLYRFGVFAK